MQSMTSRSQQDLIIDAAAREETALTSIAPRDRAVKPFAPKWNPEIDLFTSIPVTETAIVKGLVKRS